MWIDRHSAKGEKVERVEGKVSGLKWLDGIKVFRSSRGQMKGEEGVYRYCYCGWGHELEIMWLQSTQIIVNRFKRSYL